MAKTKTKTYDPGCLLQTSEQKALYIQEAWEQKDNAVLMDALKTVAEINGITELSQVTGISRGHIHKIFSCKHSPSMSNVTKILIGLDMKVLFVAQ